MDPVGGYALADRGNWRAAHARSRASTELREAISRRIGRTFDGDRGVPGVRSAVEAASSSAARPEAVSKALSAPNRMTT